MARLPGFAKLSPTERIEALLKEGLLTWDEAQILKEQKGLPLSIADQLTENVLSTFDLPFSLAPYFLINGRDYVLPMVTEEPSVVAGCQLCSQAHPTFRRLHHPGAPAPNDRRDCSDGG